MRFLLVSLSLSPRELDGANDSGPATCCCDKNRPDSFSPGISFSPDRFAKLSPNMEISILASFIQSADRPIVSRVEARLPGYRRRNENLRRSASRCVVSCIGDSSAATSLADKSYVKRTRRLQKATDVSRESDVRLSAQLKTRCK